MPVQVKNPLIAVGLAQFALSLLQVVFMFFYVKVYINVFHVSQWWFSLAQIVFMIWNAINDPLFGYLQDSHPGWLGSRTQVITRFTPFLCGAFLFLWFPWDTTGSWLEGVHLIAALCLYDAFFSAMGVAWSALFAETTPNKKARAAAMKYSQLAILFSVNGIAIMEKVSHSLENFVNFQIVAGVMAVLAFFCLLSAGTYRPTLPVHREEDSDREGLLPDSSTAIERQEKEENGGSWEHAWKLTKQTLCEKDFVVITATNFLHIMRSIAHLNFASITTELLIPQEILPKGSLRLSLFYGLCTLGPQVFIIGLERVVVALGAGRLLLLSYVCSIVSALVFAFFKGHSSYGVMLFMLIDSITVHSAQPLFNIIFSDYIDGDKARYSRKSPISSFVFALNAFFTKPAQSVAPIFIVFVLNHYGYQGFLLNHVPTSQLQDAVQYVLFGTPLILGTFQYLLFSNYSLISRPPKSYVI